MNKYFRIILYTVSLLFPLSSSYASDLLVEELEVFSDPFMIPGKFITHPEEGSRPTIFWCHGGPHGSTDFSLLRDLSLLTESNVVGFDFRGSKPIGYQNVQTQFDPANSSEFENSPFYTSVNADYGGGDMNDLKAVVKHVIETYGNSVDSTKLVIAGHSFGGYMAAMAITDPSYSETFKLGVICSGFYDLRGFKDINCPGNASDPEIQRRRSPLSFTQNITQPIILVHGGEQDKTTLLSRSDAELFMNNALSNGKHIRSIFMDDEVHDYKDESWGHIGEEVSKAIQELL